MTSGSTSATPNRAARFARFAWVVLATNVAVILWGAFVRATGSGAGCGRHWPMCNGEVVPRAPRIETLIELTHRVTSGIALVLVVVLVAGAFATTPKGHPARRASLASLGFILGEAALGAGLVLFELVAHDASMKRALSMMLHLGNTFLLLGALTLTAWYASGGARMRIRGQGFVAVPLLIAACGMLVLGASGALAALGDTLFPAKSIAEGIQQDISPGAHALIKLRVLHPLVALFVGLLVAAAGTCARLLRPDAPHVRKLSRALTAMFLLQICVGLLNLRLLVPVSTQLLHLFCADATWVLLVLTCAVTLRGAPRETAEEAALEAAPTA
jgi:heme A synthase